MIDFNDFQQFDEKKETTFNEKDNKQLDMNIMDNMNMNNLQIDEEEQKRINDRQKEAEERKEKIKKKMEEEEKARNEIRKKAIEYITEFETKRQEEIAKKRKELEEKESKPNIETNGNSDSWSKVKDNIDLKDSEYKGTKDVQRMREAMLNKKNDPNSEPLKNFFG